MAAPPGLISVFDPSCFADPGDQQPGNAPRYFEDLFAQGIDNVDLGVRKQFNIREHMRFQIRGEAFNAFNRTRFDRAEFRWVGRASAKSPDWRTDSTRARCRLWRGSSSEGVGVLWGRACPAPHLSPGPKPILPSRRSLINSRSTP